MATPGRATPGMAILGGIADDLAGATELAGALSRGGLETGLCIGLPATPPPGAEAVVVALETRHAPPRRAVAESLAACEALLAAGCRRVLLHHGPAFDSTPDGNIGPVADALIRRLDAGFAPVCPAFPGAGRTVYQGHLFLGAALLGEGAPPPGDGGPAPARDPNLRRLLGAQADGAVGLVPFPMVEAGPAAIRRALTGLKEGGRAYGLLDSLTDAHLLAVAEACAAHPLLLGTAGLGAALAARLADGLPAPRPPRGVPPGRGRAAVLSGALSRTTLAQLGYARDRMFTLELDLLATPDAARLAGEALAWAGEQPGEAPLLLATSTSPDRAAALRARLGAEATEALVRETLARLAEGLVARGFGRLLVAGTDTAGTLLGALGPRTLRVGAEIDPGIPWLRDEATGLHLAVKPGGAGARDVFLKAFEA